MTFTKFKGTGFIFYLLCVLTVFFFIACSGSNDSDTLVDDEPIGIEDDDSTGDTDTDSDVTQNCPPLEEGYVRLTDLDSVTTFLNTYGDCDTITGSIFVDLREGIPSELLAHIKHVTGNFTVINIGIILEEFELFNNLETVGGNFEILHNRVTNFRSFQNLRRVSGDFRVEENNGLGVLGGFDMLEYIGGELIYYDNSYNSITGFDALTEVGGQLKIYDNDFLQNINAFEVLSRTADLIIEFNEALSEITGFNGDLSINGNLLILRNFSLQRLEGFADLLQIAGWMEITENRELVEIIGFEKLQKVQGAYLKFSANDRLETIPAFALLTSITGPLEINYNNLSQLDGFPQLTSAGGITIERENLTDITGFESLSHINGFLTMYSLPITTISGFTNLGSIEGQISLTSLDNLLNIDFLGQVTTVGGHVNIRSNPKLMDLDGLGSITFVGGDFSISENLSLNRVHGPEDLRTVNGEILIVANTSVTEISGFETLEFTDALRILSNLALNSFGGFNQLTSIGKSFEFSRSGNLVEMETCFGSLEHIGTDFWFSDMEKLSGIDGFGNLRSVGGRFYMSQTNLSNLDFLQNLNAIGQKLFLDVNFSLTQVDALAGVTSNLQDLTISRNPLLNSIAGIGNVGSISGSLIIERNELLSECNVASICSHLSMGKTNEIIYNGMGCNSMQEVLSACN